MAFVYSYRDVVDNIKIFFGLVGLFAHTQLFTIGNKELCDVFRTQTTCFYVRDSPIFDKTVAHVARGR